METPREESIEAQLKTLTTLVIEGFKRVEGKFDQVDNRLDSLDKKVDTLDKKVDSLDKEVKSIKRELDKKPDRSELEALKTELDKKPNRSELQALSTELDKKPDRDEVRDIVHYEAKHDPRIYILDRELAEFLDKMKLRGLVKEVVYEVLAEKR